MQSLRKIDFNGCRNMSKLRKKRSYIVHSGRRKKSKCPEISSQLCWNSNPFFHPAYRVLFNWLLNLRENKCIIKFNVRTFVLFFFVYSLNTLLRKQGVWENTTFMKNYFNDCLAMETALAVLNLYLALRRKKGVYHPVLLLLAWVEGCMVWEYGALYIRTGSVFDPLDILCYFFGTVVYYLLYKICLHRASSGKNTRKSSAESITEALP